jgi:hypothetical protein
LRSEPLKWGASGIAARVDVPQRLPSDGRELLYRAAHMVVVLDASASSQVYPAPLSTKLFDFRASRIQRRPHSRISKSSAGALPPHTAQIRDLARFYYASEQVANKLGVWKFVGNSSGVSSMLPNKLGVWSFLY